MANQEIDVIGSVGTQTEGIKISATLSNTIWENQPDHAIAADLVGQLKLWLVFLYVIRTGANFEQAAAAIAQHVSDIH